MLDAKITKISDLCGGKADTEFQKGVSVKITATYKTSVQVGPEDWNVYTEVVHLDENDTLKSVHEKLTKGFGEHSNKKFDGEIHFDCWEAKKP